MPRLIVAAFLVQLVACSSSVTPILGCTASDGLTPICEFRNPEDLAPTPSGHWLLVSQIGNPDATLSGSIAGYEPASGRVEVLFPVGEFDDVREWGERSCAPPVVTEFSPHGIDLERRTDGELALLAVNHGGRESVEFFAVEENEIGLALYWRGCVLAPPAMFFNDVLIRGAGGFWVTDMMPRNHQLWATLTGLLGANTGRVYRWTHEAGFVAVVGSDMPFPNGIEKSPDESVLYVASFFGNEVRKIDAASGAVVGHVAMQRPDNLTWNADGKLLVASHADSFMELMACRNVPQGACGAAFEVIQVDAASLTSLVLLAHRGAPIGGVSVALQHGDDLYLGSVAGDRIARWQIHP
jgi:hypothetical protein